MKDFDSFDIATLYKELIILKEERESPVETVQTKEEKQIVPEKTTPKPRSNKKITITPPEPRSPFDNVKRAIVCTKQTKQLITAEGSSLSKIAEALSIPLRELRFISLDEIKIKDWLMPIETLWFIGLNPNQESKLQGLGQHVLFSPNPEVLTTVDEKRAMYEPIKAFAKHLQ